MKGETMSRPLLMIPGPVEVDEQVLAALAEPPPGHTSKAFIEAFGSCLEGLRAVFCAPDGQPIVVSGSGTLAMELAVANVIEPGDRAVALDTGYFSKRMGDIMARHGAQVEVVSATVGDRPALEQVEAALRRGAKALSITHVDTSTGVLAAIPELAALARRYDALTIVDGVCATAGEEFEMAGWDVDLCLTASQKAFAVPAGAALVMARPRAIAAFEARTHPVYSYYCDWGSWLPVLRAYEARKPSYFATPATNLFMALNIAVRQMLEEGLQERWTRHRKLGASMRAALQAFGLKLVPVRSELCADTLSVAYYPDGVGDEFIGRVLQQGVAIAGGLHPEIRGRYFRVGHMGVTTDAEIVRTVQAIEAALIESGIKIEKGAGVTAAQAAYASAQ
jgi:alanine-glyoxylate transaminase/serine-glyoxylate transaminase/serine-pyruvate transaminase